MLKTVALATLLTIGCTANAAPTWSFSYTGFLDQNTGIFANSYKLTGSFSGKDGNHDGYLDKTEITSFFLNGTDYLGCAGSDDGLAHCGTDKFLYKIGGALDFAAGSGGTDPEGYFGGGHYFIAGDREYSYEMTPHSYTENAYLWTDQTKFSIGKRVAFSSYSSLEMQVLAVPEPGTWAMLATGLLVVMGSARRRKGALPVRA